MPAAISRCCSVTASPAAAAAVVAVVGSVVGAVEGTAEVTATRIDIDLIRFTVSRRAGGGPATWRARRGILGKSDEETMSTTILDVGDRISDTPVWSGELIGRSTTPQPGTYRVRAAVPVGSKGKYAMSEPLDILLVQ